MKFNIRRKEPHEFEVEYLSKIVTELMTKFDVRIETTYITDLNILEVYIDDRETGKNKISIYGDDCCDDSVRLGRPPIEIAMLRLYDYLENIYGKKEPETNVVANFSCPNCGASVDIGSNHCGYCGTHFSYVGG